MKIEVLLEKVIEGIAAFENVRAIGKTGGLELSDGDIDICVYCDDVPAKQEREALAISLNGEVDRYQIEVGSDRFWGTVDFLYHDNDDICIMYHRICDIDADLQAVLDGRRLDKEDNFYYPTGLCASMLSMGVYVDKDGYLAHKQALLSHYPDDLAITMMQYHSSAMINDEDFGRAVQRKDPLFYHSVLDGSMDHFLQALFALNKTWFPSRKRSAQYIERFANKPGQCLARMLEVLALGSSGETVGASYEVWRKLMLELHSISSAAKA